jgi:hypothetical protein
MTRGAARWAVIAAMLATPAQAQSANPMGAPPVWRVEHGAGLELFLSGLAGATRAHDAACLALQQSAAAGSAGSGQMWLRVDGGHIRLLQDNGQGLDALDAPWAKAALAAAAVAGQFGQTSAPLDLWLRWRDGRYEVGTRGGSGQRFEDACAALGHLISLLLAASHAPPAVRDLFDRPLDNASAPLAARIVAIGRILSHAAIFVGRGATATVILDALPFATAPTVVATQGIVLRALYQQNGQWVAELAVSADAALDDGSLAIFAPGTRFAPAYTIPIRVVAGQQADAQPDAGSSAGTALIPGTSISGAVTGGRTRSHALSLAADSTVTIRSEGNSDVTAELVDGSGQTLASNDDGAGQYNFNLSMALPAGDYELRVRSCCAQTANYGVNLSVSDPR